MVQTLRNYVGGEWVASTASETREVINPATGEVLAKVPLGTAADVDAAVKAAEAAFTDWRRVPPVERARYLFRYKQILEERKGELAEVVTREHGKALPESA